MSHGAPGQPGGGDAGGVFGNLPGSRPGSRSPRRRSGDASAPAKAKPPRKRVTAARQKPERPRPEPRAPEPEGAPADRPGGLEDVAWAGVAVAAEAATIGVRLASRAIEALRGSTERGSEKE
jgi:hypothetical protein